MDDKVDREYTEYKYEGSNALILPPKKDAARKKKEKKIEPPKKILSNTEKKKLQKTVAKKLNKLERNELWKQLEELKDIATTGLEPTSTIHSQNRKQKNKDEKKAKQGPIGKCKSWKIKGKKEEEVKEEAKDDSTDTDDYSTDEENMDTGEPIQKKDMGVSEENTASAASTVEMDTSKAAEVHSTSNTEDVSAASTTEVPTTKAVHATPKQFVLVNRNPTVQAARLELPILGEETMVMEAINEHDVVVLCGETGCGKTTQVPQFLYEAGFTRDGMKIAVTEPRRVAAMAMSQRVAHELNLSERKVSYQIRYEGNVTSGTEIKFMTDGVLLQEVKKDFELSGYSAVLVDEAHERSVYTDVLIGLLSLIVALRRRHYEERLKTGEGGLPPLKLVVMSATLRVEDFTENRRLFREMLPPLVKVDARQHEVRSHFSRYTDPDYLKAAYKKVCKVHREMPEGGILVFVTGQQEVHTLCRWLKQTFPFSEEAVKEVVTETQGSRKARTKGDKANLGEMVPSVSLDKYSIIPLDEEVELDVEKMDDDSEAEEDMPAEGGGMAPVFTLPLYSLLPADKQARVFQAPPAGQRLVVVATNVAETSLTIPGIRYVVDTGKMKAKVYDSVTGVSTFQVVWTSRASSEQRAGRSGRLGPGHCYRLFTSHIFQDVMQEYSEPEILQRPIDDVVLMLKSYLGPTSISRFPLPTPPSGEAVRAAEDRLVALGALEMQGLGIKAVLVITRTGRWMSRLPVAPRFAKMLLLSNQAGLLPYTVVMVAALSVQELLYDTTEQDGEGEDPAVKERNSMRRNFKRQFVQNSNDLLLGDLCVLIGSVCALERCGHKLRAQRAFDWEDQLMAKAEQYGIRWKAFKEVKQLRKQITDILNANVPGLQLNIDPTMDRPTPEQFVQLRQIVLAGSPWQVARRLVIPDNVQVKEKRQLKNAYECTLMDEPVFIHPQSVLARDNYEWIVFQDVHRSSATLSKPEPGKAYMRGISVITSDWLPRLAGHYVTSSGHVTEESTESTSAGKPLPPPFYDPGEDQMMCYAQHVSFGSRMWPLDPRSCPVAFPSKGQGASAHRWFGRALLEGQVVEGMAQWKDQLKSTCPPRLLTVSWGMIRPQVKSLASDLWDSKVRSKRALMDKWRTEPKFLLHAFTQWVKDSERFALAAAWPPVDLEAQTDVIDETV